MKAPKCFDLKFPTSLVLIDFFFHFYSVYILFSYTWEVKSESENHSVLSNSLQPHGLTIQSMEFSRPENWSG